MADETSVQVSAKDVIVGTPQRRAKFFDALTALPHTFAALKERTRRYAWFPQMLSAYLRIINDRLEDVPAAAALPDDEFLGLCNWLLLQGHDAIQRFLDTAPEDVPAAYLGADGRPPSAQAFWFSA